MALRIFITDWGLTSYLDLKHRRVFSDPEYWSTIRPDVERLKNFPNDPLFSVASHWGPATHNNGNVVADGFKMKWDSVGSGKVELRSCVAIVGSQAFLCDAFVKNSSATDYRHAARLQGHIKLIRANRHVVRGAI